MGQNGVNDWDKPNASIFCCLAGICPAYGVWTIGKNSGFDSTKYALGVCLCSMFQPCILIKWKQFLSSSMGFPTPDTKSDCIAFCCLLGPHMDQMNNNAIQWAGGVVGGPVAASTE